MIYTVTAEPKEIDFAATGIDEIMQNIRIIVTTVRETVPMDRGFGLDNGALDGPLVEVTQARMTDRIFDAVSQHETRVEITRVEYTEDHENGKLIPIVTFRLREGVSL